MLGRTQAERGDRITKTVHLVGAFPEGWAAKADLGGAPGGQLSAQLTILLLGTSMHVSAFSELGTSETEALATLSREALIWIHLYDGAAGKVERDDLGCCTL